MVNGDDDNLADTAVMESGSLRNVQEELVDEGEEAGDGPEEVGRRLGMGVTGCRCLPRHGEQYLVDGMGC